MSYLGNTPGVSSQRFINTYTATAGQTVFTATSGYSLGYIDVYLNGVKLSNSGADYTASDGTTITLTQAASAGDVVELVAYLPRGLSDGYLKSEVDAALATKMTASGPAFSAYRNTNQAVAANTTTKVQLPNEDFDTANCFDSTTNYRFTPTVPGYYQINFGIYANSSANSITLIFAELYKNGVGLPISLGSAGSYTYTPSYPYYDGKAGGSVLLYMNGSTDYVELYGRINGGGTLNFGQAVFQGFLARAA